MTDYRVCVDYTVRVMTTVTADSEDEARDRACEQILDSASFDGDMQDHDAGVNSIVECPVTHIGRSE